MRNVIGPVVSLATLLCIGPSVRADVIPPDVYACNGKQVGDSCSDTSVTGICQTSSCTKLDYSQWNRDASSGPPSVIYACVKCTPGTATSTKTTTQTSTPMDAGTMDAGTSLDAGTTSSTQTATTSPTTTATATTTSSSTQTATTSPTATTTSSSTQTVTSSLSATATSSSTQTATTSPTATNAGTDTNTDNGRPPTSDDGWCTLGKGVAAKRIAPWVMAASFSLLFLWARRRRR